MPSATPPSNSGEDLRFASALTTQTNVEVALNALAHDVQARLDRIDLSLVFFSADFLPDAEAIADGLQRRLAPGVLLGCSAEGVIGREHEIERRPAITLVGAKLPNVELSPFAFDPEAWRTTLESPAAFHEVVQAGPDANLFLLLAEPFSTPASELLDCFNSEFPGVPVAGGVASGAMQPQGNVLLLNGERYRSGAVGAALSGEFDVEVIVSQGCRPIGQSHQVTAAEGNVILSLDGQPPLACIEEMIGGMSLEERALLRRNGLFLGRAMDSSQQSHGRGDFLIRGVMGIDRDRGALVVGDEIANGEVVQFHVRDAETAAEDLDMLLSLQGLYEPPAGAILFSCNGRGMRLYNRPDGDISTVQQALGGIDLAGFFCAGELGPVSGMNFLHGHTASLVLFRPLSANGPELNL